MLNDNIGTLLCKMTPKKKIYLVIHKSSNKEHYFIGNAIFEDEVYI